MPTAVARTHWLLVLLLCGCGVLAGGQFAKISIEFMRLRAVYEVSAASMGAVLSTVGVMGLLGGVAVGLIAPRVGYRRLLLLGLTGGALVSALQATLPPFGLLWASRVVEGAAHLAIMVAGPTLLIPVCVPAQRTAVMGMWATVVGLAFAVMAGLDRLLPQGLAPREALAGHALLMLAAAAAVRAWVVDPPAAATPDAAPPAAPARLVALHREVYREPATRLPGLAFFFYAFATIALITFVPRFSGLGNTAFVTLLPLMATAGTLAAGWLARHMAGGLRLVLLCYAAFALAAGALGATALAGGPTEALALLTLGCAGLSGGAASTLIPQLNPWPAQQSRASGVLVQLGNLGSVCGPPLFAAVAERFALAGVAALAALVALLALAVLGTAARRAGLRSRG